VDYQKYLTQIKKQNIGCAEEAACELFCEQGIESVKMTDVARRAKIGVASLYRYFDTKEKLVIACAVRMWSEVIGLILPDYKSEGYSKLSGYEKVCRIFRVYKVLCDEHRDFVKFVALFDSYCLNNQIEPSKLADYEQLITMLYRYFSDAFDCGVNDGSIRKGVNKKEFYLTCNHALMAVVQKLISGEILSQDDFASSREVDVMTDIFLSYLKA
jgi:AcrR family transcriptional regulator